MENMTNTKALAINDIELLTFDEAAEIALDYINIKDHDILFVDFGGYFDVAPLDAGENLRRDICLTMEQRKISFKGSLLQGVKQKALY